MDDMGSKYGALVFDPRRMNIIRFVDQNVERLLAPASISDRSAISRLVAGADLSFLAKAKRGDTFALQVSLPCRDGRARTVPAVIVPHFDDFDRLDYCEMKLDLTGVGAVTPVED